MLHDLTQTPVFRRFGLRGLRWLGAIFFAYSSALLVLVAAAVTLLTLREPTGSAGRAWVTVGIAALAAVAGVGFLIRMAIQFRNELRAITAKVSGHRLDGH